MSNTYRSRSTRIAARGGVAAATLFALVAIGCKDTASPAPPLVVPAFVYVADVSGYQTLMKWDNGTVTPLTSGSNNYEPNSKAGKLVFTSTRDVMPQIYLSDAAVTTVVRVTCSDAFDVTASLSPAGDSIAFVSTRSGTPRVWIVNAPSLTPPLANAASICPAPAALATGSADYVPESGPAWNPLGGTIAYTSTRDGVSQLYVIASGGGTPVKLTNEMLGAFEPNWSADGSTLYYVAATPGLVLRSVSVAGGAPTTMVDVDHDGDMDVGGPMSCASAVCLFSTDPTETGGDMFVISPTGLDQTIVFTRTAALERQPTILTH